MVQRVKDIMHAYVMNIHGITKVSDALSIMKDENIQTILVRPRNDDDVLRIDYIKGHCSKGYSGRKTIG